MKTARIRLEPISGTSSVVVVDSRTREALRALGWTPPTE